MDVGDLTPELMDATRAATVLYGVLAHGRLDERSRERIEDAIGDLLATDEPELRRIVADSHEHLLRELLLLAVRGLIANIRPADHLTEAAAAVGSVLLDGDVDPRSRKVLLRLRRRLTE